MHGPEAAIAVDDLSVSFTLAEVPGVLAWESAPSGDFGQVGVGEVVTRTYTLSHQSVGAVDGTITATGTGFSIQSGAGAFSLASGDSRSVTVAFAPSRSGLADGTLSASGGGDPTVELSGEGVTDDGIAAEVELGAPNNGDGNGYGVPDHEQPNVASFRAADEGGYVTIETSGGLYGVSSLASGALPTDPGLVSGFGVNSFRLESPVGGDVNVTIYYANLRDATRYVYRKLNTSTSTWYTLASAETGATSIKGKQVGYVQFTLTDGGTGDDDGTANGTIVDPGTLAEPASAVPTLNEWGMIIMTLGLALMVFLRSRAFG
ncbi:IPTL-CTERM sorting domain-containing protein [Planctomycetota bacterium]